MPVLQLHRPVIRVYSDASFEPGSNKPARIGFVVLPHTGTPVGMTAVIPDNVIAAFDVRDQQITPLEAYCAIAVPFNVPEMLGGSDLIWYIDNQAACACLIKGSSSVSDIGTIVTIAHLLYVKLHIRVYFEWVDTNANISDGLSRVGLVDPWTMNQNWQLYIAELPNFMELATLCLPDIFHTLFGK